MLVQQILPEDALGRWEPQPLRDRVGGDLAVERLSVLTQWHSGKIIGAGMMWTTIVINDDL